MNHADPVGWTRRGRLPWGRRAQGDGAPERQRPRLEPCSREPCGPRRLDKEREAALGPPGSGRRGPWKAEAQTRAMQP